MIIFLKTSLTIGIEAAITGLSYLILLIIYKAVKHNISQKWRRSMMNFILLMDEFILSLTIRN